MRYLFYYLIFINILNIILFGMDKYKAIHQKNRIRNSTLIGLSLLGGSIGTLIGMYIFRHKTKTWYYKYTTPIILIIQIITFYYFRNI